MNQLFLYESTPIIVHQLKTWPSRRKRNQKNQDNLIKLQPIMFIKPKPWAADLETLNLSLRIKDIWSDLEVK